MSNGSVKTLVVQVLKQADQPLSAQEITKRAILLDNPAPTEEENQLTSTKLTNKQLRAIRNSLSPLINDGVIDKIRLKRKEVKYLWMANQEKAERQPK